ncbi:inositol 2-dehydrogenase-like [Lineus longissimus]|uniref:inositol 2-dehydrogenase-like n=1 Tax=Lineus longissimus TaxID=88925 RepID=UPI002B4F3C6A
MTTNCSSDRKVGLAIIGMGRAGQIHLKNVIQNWRIRLLWMVDSDRAIAERLAGEYNLEGVSIATCDEVENVYNDPRVQAVIVSSPTFTHEAYIRGALAAGKAVFSEKPISQDTSGVIQCYDDAKKFGKPLFCSFNRRFDEAFNSIKQQVRKGVLGDMYMVKTCSRDNPVPSMEYLKISGGIFHDCAVHDIDLICWLLGEYPTEVYVAAHAHMKDVAAMNDVDTVAISLTFPSKVIAIIDLCRMGVYGYHQTLEAFGSKGMLTAENQRPTNLQHSTVEGMSMVPIEYSFPQRHAKGYVKAIDSFLDVLEGKEDVGGMVATKESTVNVSRIAEACEESVKTGQAVKIKY